MRTYIWCGEPTLLHPLLLFFTNLQIPVSMLIARTLRILHQRSRVMCCIFCCYKLGFMIVVLPILEDQSEASANVSIVSEGDGPSVLLGNFCICTILVAYDII